MDLCIDSSKGDVMYCVMESKNKELRAIPLGAFVMPSTSYRWLIELPRAEILKFAPFDMAAPPSQVDHAWQEYVAVRYGRTGLQPEPAAN